MSEPTLYRETSDPNDPLPPRGDMHRDTPPGSRLAIANAYAVGRLVEVVPVERCEHGNTERHIIETSIHLTSNATYTLKWCEGADLGGGV